MFIQMREEYIDQYRPCTAIWMLVLLFVLVINAHLQSSSSTFSEVTLA